MPRTRTCYGSKVVLMHRDGPNPDAARPRLRELILGARVSLLLLGGSVSAMAMRCSAQRRPAGQKRSQSRNRCREILSVRRSARPAMKTRPRDSPTTRIPNWPRCMAKSGVTCEACHGPGKAHVDGGGDMTKIFNPAKATAKEVDAKCLGCHQGQHANFERSAHGEGNVSCVELPQCPRERRHGAPAQG